MSRTRRPFGADERPPDAPGDQPLLVVEHLNTGFNTPLGRVRAVDDVSLTLERGKTLGIVGESGSGKTVLARSIMGLLPRTDVVRDGSIRFEGTELIARSPKQLRAFWGTEMAMIFQDPMTSLNPVTRVGAQITESLLWHFDISKSFACDTAIALLASVGIPEPERRFRQYPHELSGGMRQRIVIAIALSCGPKLLLADEPTTALDVTVQGQILDLLARAQAERNMSMMLVTHDLGVAAGRADDIAVMYAGRIVEKAPAEVLFSHVQMPYTEALLGSIPRITDPSHTRLHAIAGRPPNLITPPPGCRFAPRCPYAQDKCRQVEPPLVAAESPDHLFRCWFPIGTPTLRATTTMPYTTTPYTTTPTSATET